MTRPEANITVNVDVTNPGQFFACCGLLELADRLWPGAEGWFENDRFLVACDGEMNTLLRKLSDCELNSSVGDEGLKRLGTLMSAKKSKLTSDELSEKAYLRSQWQAESLILGDPFDLVLNWWRDEHSNRTPLKTWAAKQLILDILRPLSSSVAVIAETPPFDDIFQRKVKVQGLPLFFDSHVQSQSTEIDTGFSTYDLRHVIKEGISTRPALELFAFIGMQRFRLMPRRPDGTFTFNAWYTPSIPPIAAIATVGIVRSSQDTCFQFRLLDRTKYMKAFLPATPQGAL